jgi:hypothetical protein
VLGMTAELCRAVPMVQSRCDDAHAQLRSRCEGNATARKWLPPYTYNERPSPGSHAGPFRGVESGASVETLSRPTADDIA